MSTHPTFRPNFFLALPIDNPPLIQKLTTLQESICIAHSDQKTKSTDAGELIHPKPQLKMMPAKKFHFTALLLTVQNNSQLEGLINILQDCSKLIDSEEFSDITLNIEGTGQFDNGRVVFVRAKEDNSFEMLKMLFKLLHRKIKIAFPTCVTSNFQFDPHLTIYKSRRKKYVNNSKCLPQTI